MRSKTDVVVIGGGASGMMAAIVCARQNKSVTILEHNDKLGRKLSATGNGKCNYTNEIQSYHCYHLKDKKILDSIFSQFNKDDTIAFFKKLGIYPREKNGYYYPYSEQANSIVEALRSELVYQKVKIKLQEHILEIERQKETFKISTDSYSYYADKVILAAGGTAASVLGSDGSGYDLAKQLGHSITTIYPGLASLKAAKANFSSLAGIRIKAKATLIADSQVVSTEQGEIQFTSYGISGIPIFQFSRYAAIALDQQKKVSVALDLAAEFAYDDFACLLKDIIKENPHKTIKEILSGFFDIRLCHLFIERCELNKKVKGTELSKQQLADLTGQVKNLVFEIKAVNSLEQAQVTVGGISWEEVYIETLESKKTSGLYFAGELLDVDGACGGYNLQWAWSTGFVAGYHAGLEGQE